MTLLITHGTHVHHHIISLLAMQDACGTCCYFTLLAFQQTKKQKAKIKNTSYSNKKGCIVHRCIAVDVARSETRSYVATHPILLSIYGALHLYYGLSSLLHCRSTVRACPTR